MTTPSPPFPASRHRAARISATPLPGPSRRRFLALLAGLPALLASPPAAPGQDEKAVWRVGTWKTAQTIQPFLERYAPGVRVDVIPFTNPIDQKAALLAGLLDMTGTTAVTAIQAAAKGEPVALAASLCNKCSALVARRGQGMKSSQDLKGKRVGYVRGSIHEMLLRETLRLAGLTPGKDVTLAPLDFFAMGKAIKDGEIDAFLSGEPFPTQAARDGYGEILGYPYHYDAFGTINGALLVHKDLIKRDPEKVAAMVAAHMRATKALKADLALWLGQASRLFGVDLDILETASLNMELAWDLSDAYVRHVKNLGARMKEHGLIEREPGYDALMDRRFVDMARQAGS
jgi:NitT/TauT family transport system substrate-binding protein